MLTLNPTCVVPPLDPLPFLTRRFRESGALERTNGGLLAETAVASIRGTIRSVVSGLNEDPKPFVVVFGKNSTAMTDLKARIVKVGTRAMDDTALSDGRMAAVMVGLAYHEVAHINYDRDYVKDVVARASGHPQRALVTDVHNIAQDVRIERRIATALPGYAPTLDAVLWYMTEHTGAKAEVAKTVGVSPSVARNMFFAAVRAPWIVRDWTGSEAARTWGHDWAERFAATNKKAVICDLIIEALDMIDSWTVGYVAPPPSIEEPPEGPKGDKDDGGDFTDEPDSSQPPTKDEDEGISSPPPEEEDEEPEPDADEDEPDDDDGDGRGEADDANDDDWADDEDDEGEDDPGASEEGGEEPTDGDLSQKWGDNSGIATAGKVHGEDDEPEAGLLDDRPTLNIEDLEFPTCAADALAGPNDDTYETVAARIEKSREESATRIIRTPGWPDRKVIRRWDWNHIPE